jgi:hypothetical protein
MNGPYDLAQVGRVLEIDGESASRLGRMDSNQRQHCVNRGQRRRLCLGTRRLRAQSLGRGRSETNACAVALREPEKSMPELGI